MSKSIVVKEKSFDSRSTVVNEETKKREKMIKQMDYNKTWQEKNNLTRMTFRLPAEQRKQFETHAKERGESLTRFIIRSCTNQIKVDIAAKSLDIDKPLSE